MMTDGELATMVALADRITSIVQRIERIERLLRMIICEKCEVAYTGFCILCPKDDDD
jgi:hypothetical protein